MCNTLPPVFLPALDIQRVTGLSRFRLPRLALKGEIRIRRTPLGNVEYSVEDARALQLTRSPSAPSPNIVPEPDSSGRPE
jgi:hypothetical protein